MDFWESYPDIVATYLTIEDASTNPNVTSLVSWHLPFSFGDFFYIFLIFGLAILGLLVFLFEASGRQILGNLDEKQQLQRSERHRRSWDGVVGEGGGWLD